MVLLKADQQLDETKGSHYMRMLMGYLACLSHTHGISHSQMSDCRAQKHVSFGNIIDPLELTHHEGEIKKSNNALQIFGRFPLGT